jgi:hypothetical protein
MPFCRQTTLADFKASHRVALGEAPTLERVNEAGEFKAGTIGEAKETIQLVTYGKLLAVTRQTLINDDLDALSRVPQRFGASAARLEGDKVWAIVTSNPTMNDSVALFHAASHKNLAGSGIAFGKSGIQSLRKLTRKQTGINAAVKLGLTLAYVALPTDLEEVLDELLANIAASSATNSVPDSIKRLQYIVEPRLDESSAIAYYGFCDPSQIDTIEYAYLAGQQGVYVETQMGFEVDGMQIKVRHDFGCAAIDHRGCYKQPGASS